MGVVFIEILIIILLILLNGFFALSEIAFLSAKKSQLRKLVREGNKKAKSALSLARAPSEMLSATQIGITAVGVVAGVFGGKTIAYRLEGVLQNYPSVSAHSESLSILIVVAIITYLSLIIGELVPKQIALAYPEKFSMRVSFVIKLIIKIAKPFIILLSLSSKLVLKLLCVKMPSRHIVSEEDVKLLIAEGLELGTFEKSEQRMVENILYLGNKPIRDFMTPKEEAIYLSLNDSKDDIKKKIYGSGKTTFLVYEGDLNNIIGVVEANDILVYLIDNGDGKIDLKELIQPVIDLESDVPSLVAIERLKTIFINIALIKEKGSDRIIGVISFHDILEAIVGEFKFTR